MRETKKLFNCTKENCGFRAFSMSELKRHMEQKHSNEKTWETYVPQSWSVDKEGDIYPNFSIQSDPVEPDTYTGGGGSFGGGGASDGWDDNGFSGGSNGDN